MMQVDIPHYISWRKIQNIVRLLDQAEYDEAIQIETLGELAFLPKNQEYILQSRRHFAQIERFLTPRWMLIPSCIVYLLAASRWGWSVALALSQVLLGGYVVLVGYHQWIRAECNRNVEDAITRKTQLNDTIKTNIQLLYPYVGRVFGSTFDYIPEPRETASHSIIDMFVFGELDNLEFIYQKAKFGLLYPEFAFRAVKIFLARTENEKFALRSSQLVVSGRYNLDFQKLVMQLIHIALYQLEASREGHI